MAFTQRSRPTNEPKRCSIQVVTSEVSLDAISARKLLRANY
jgi:hypothetical protein